MKTEVGVTGLEEVSRLLGELAPNEARNLMRSTVYDIAGQLASDAANNAPVDQGNLKTAITHRRERGAPGRFEASVIVSSKGGLPFYWRFLEFGQGPDGVEHAFFLRAIHKMRATLLDVFMETFVRKLTERLVRLGKKAGG